MDLDSGRGQWTWTVDVDGRRGWWQEQPQALSLPGGKQRAKGCTPIHWVVYLAQCLLHLPLSRR
ncbi:hypothetical protein [Planctomycetes bacterium TBK1r]|uniref:hypothetical protein n=1 Tax=Stieleria magnilauensis TaxID=2527963 RepID=UPI0011A9A696